LPHNLAHGERMSPTLSNKDVHSERGADYGLSLWQQKFWGYYAVVLHSFTFSFGLAYRKTRSIVRLASTIASKLSRTVWGPASYT
jgi:hypothetical protein